MTTIKISLSLLLLSSSLVMGCKNETKFVGRANPEKTPETEEKPYPTINIDDSKTEKDPEAEKQVKQICDTMFSMESSFNLVQNNLADNEKIFEEIRTNYDYKIKTLLNVIIQKIKTNQDTTLEKKKKTILVGNLNLITATQRKFEKTKNTFDMSYTFNYLRNIDHCKSDDSIDTITLLKKNNEELKNDVITLNTQLEEAITHANDNIIKDEDKNNILDEMQIKGQLVSGMNKSNSEIKLLLNTTNQL